jgi:hypothetical protein
MKAQRLLPLVRLIRLFFATLVSGLVVAPAIGFAQPSDANLAWAAKPTASFTSPATCQ